MSDTLASVLRADVDWTGVPPSVVRLLKKCLEKDPKRRLHDIGDTWDLIDTPPATEPVRRRQWIAWTVAALFAVAAAALAFVHFRETPRPAEIVRFQVQPPAKNTFDIYLSLSPDGRRLAFTARDEVGVVHLWVRALDSLEARQLPGTENAWSPFWSPDSRHLAFAVNRTLKRIDIAGGPPQTLGESPTIAGVGSWSPDGVIVFGTRGTGVLRRLPANGGVPVDVTAMDPARTETFHSFPFFLPDGRHFLYFRQSTDAARQGVYVGSLDATPDRQSTTRLVPATLGPVQATFGSSGGQLFYLRDRTLLAQPFDPDRQQLLGDAVPVAEGVGSSGSFGFFSASSAGAIAYRTGFANFANMQQLTWVDRTGKAVGTVGDPQPFSQTVGSLVLSPDGTRAAAAIAPQPNADLWLIEFARGVLTRFTFDDASDSSPVWAPDSSRIAFRSNRTSGDILIRDTNGATDEQMFLQTPLNETPSDWSRDGRFLLVMQASPQTGQDIAVLPVDGPKEVVSLLSTPFNETDARFSPDRRWIAYTSNESGRQEIYLRSFTVGSDEKPRVGGKWQVSNKGGISAQWRIDGKELFYRELTGGIMAVEVGADGGTIRTGQPKQLLPLAANVVQWNASADGQRFLVGIPVASPRSDPISIVLNWETAVQR